MANETPKDFDGGKLRELRAIYKQEMRDQLQKRIQNMNTKGMTNVQIAYILDISESTVRTLLPVGK